MAASKKSFLLYCDLVGVFNELSDEEAGRLIKHTLRYVNDLNPEAPDRITKLLFEPIMLQLKRDLKQWEDTRAKRSESGKLGGLNSGKTRTVINETKQNEANEANASIMKQNEANESKVKQIEANEAVTVNVTVNDTVIKKEDKEKIFAPKVALSIRENNFRDSVNLYIERAGISYSKEMVNEFLDYWTEPDKKEKMKVEKEETWETGRRLATWYKNSNKFNTSAYKKKEEQETPSVAPALTDGERLNKLIRRHPILDHPNNMISEADFRSLRLSYDEAVSFLPNILKIENRKCLYLELMDERDRRAYYAKKELESKQLNQLNK